MSIKQQETHGEPQEEVPESSQSACGTGRRTRAEKTPPEISSLRQTHRPDEFDSAKISGALETELAALREELSAVNDKYLRKLADDVNFRKRMAREKEDGQRFAVSSPPRRPDPYSGRFRPRYRQRRDPEGLSASSTTAFF